MKTPCPRGIVPAVRPALGLCFLDGMGLEQKMPLTNDGSDENPSAGTIHSMREQYRYLYAISYLLVVSEMQC